MTPTVRTRRTLFGVLAAGAVCATLAIPAANAEPDDTPAPAPAAATDDCNAATLASTISSVTTQLSTYFAGSMEMWDIEREVRRRAAVASGDPRGAAAVPDPRVVGDFGDTPGFTYRPHLESVIAHGSPPTSLLRRILLG